MWLRNIKDAIFTTGLVGCVSVGFADIYGYYRGLDKQISDSSDIVVVKLWKAPPQPPGKFLYDAANGTLSGIINSYNVEILGLLKGSHRVGTTMTLGVGSFGGPLTQEDYSADEPKPQVVPSAVRLNYDTEYFVFLKTPQKTLNRTFNALRTGIKTLFSRIK